MSNWKTYLIIYFGAETESPLEIAKRLEEIGFEASFGAIDFTYTWGENQPAKEDVLELAGKVSKVLKGTGSVFNLDTHD